MTYESAFQELQAITTQLQQGLTEIDELSGKAARAAELINFCKENLQQLFEA